MEEKARTPVVKVMAAKPVMAAKARTPVVKVMAAKARTPVVKVMAAKARAPVVKVMEANPGRGKGEHHAMSGRTLLTKAGRSPGCRSKARILRKSHECRSVAILSEIVKTPQPSTLNPVPCTLHPAVEQNLLQHFLQKLPVDCRPDYPTRNPNWDDARSSVDPGPPVPNTTGLSECQAKILSRSPAVFMVLKHLAVDWQSWAELWMH